MKRKSWIKEKLENHRHMVQELKSDKIELDFIKNSYGQLKSPIITEMPHTSSLNCDSAFNEITQKDKNIERLNRKINHLEKAIEADWLEISELLVCLKPVEKLVLKLRYHRDAEWEEVSSSIYSRRPDYKDEKKKYKHNTQAIHRRALLSLLKQEEAK